MRSGPAQAADSAATRPARAPVLKLSIQEDKIPGADLPAKLDQLEQWGFQGIELRGKGLPGRVQSIRQAMKGHPLRISAVCTGIDGWLISEEKETRDLAVRSAKEILSAAGELGSTGLIIVPAFNRQPSLPHKEARQLLTGFARWDEADRKREGALLADLGEHAARCGTRLLLEPLNRQECYFMRTLADAASICRDVESPGIAMMGDFWHMTWEETSDLGAFVTAADYLHHVHIASRRRRKMPGEDGEADSYVQGFKGLKWIGYQDFVSFECGSLGRPEVTIPAAAELIRRQWSEA
jgi:sugar phosphate isomerase/epimerase